jgi:acyl carrier protein
MNRSPAAIRQQVRDFILRELIRSPSYALEDDEPLMSSGLIDSACIAQLAVFFETAFDVYVPDTELTVENLDTIDLIVRRLGEG